MDSADTAGGVEKMRFQVGDLLSYVPPAQCDKDIYLLSAILHGFDDDSCIKSLTHVAHASGNSGVRVAIMEVVLPEVKADVAKVSFDMQMFVGTRGRERTLPQ